VYTAEEIEKIASLYFEGAELSAVREVIEKVESGSHTLETIDTDPGDYLKHPAERRKKAA
jgi:Asp-tRNA(Asn)/Glu-tRNA(Gln) amidotransferase C subunit